jgi:branched-chain amino acid aminotransferase
MTSSEGTGEQIVYVNGEFLTRSRAKISVFDHVILYGDGVYDTMCSHNYRIFKLDEHIDRLFESAHAVKIEIPHSKQGVRDIILETVRRNELASAYVKVVATRGVGALPLLSPYNCVPGFIVFAVPYMSQAGTAAEVGLKMMVSSMRRIPNECTSTKVKSCNYLNHVLMRLEANEAGADEAVELDMEGYVCEAPGYNVFAAKAGVLTTPADNILMGITRSTVIEIAEEEKLTVRVCRVQVFDLYSADEVFLTSTAGGIVPVVRLDGRVIGSGKPGPITKMLQRKYQRLLESGKGSAEVLSANIVRSQP